MSSVLGDGPVVLVFAPAALTGACTTEMCTFRDSIADFDAVNARVYGVSVDLLYAQNVQESATWTVRTGNSDFEVLVSWTHDAVKEATARSLTVEQTLQERVTR